MNRLFSKFVSTAVFSIAAIASIATVGSTFATAAEYHPADLGADSNNAYSKGGHIESKDGVLTLQAPSNSTVEFWNNKIAVNNGTVTVETRFSANSNLKESRLRIIFNRVDPLNYWTLQINPSGKFLIAKSVDGNYQFLHPSTLTPALKKGTMVWNTLSIVSTNDSIKAFINGTEVFSTPHKFLANARVGLVSQDPGTADFKNFEVTY